MLMAIASAHWGDAEAGSGLMGKSTEPPGHHMSSSVCRASSHMFPSFLGNNWENPGWCRIICPQQQHIAVSMILGSLGSSRKDVRILQVSDKSLRHRQLRLLTLNILDHCIGGFLVQTHPALLALWCQYFFKVNDMIGWNVQVTHILGLRLHQHPWCTARSCKFGDGQLPVESDQGTLNASTQGLA